MRCELLAILDRKAGTSLKLAYLLWDKQVPLWTEICIRAWASHHTAENQQLTSETSRWTGTKAMPMAAPH